MRLNTIVSNVIAGHKRASSPLAPRAKLPWRVLMIYISKMHTDCAI